jgi:hypothetical protein
MYQYMISSHTIDYRLSGGSGGSVDVVLPGCNAVMDDVSEKHAA